MQTDSGVQLLPPALRRQITQANDEMARSALRVLGFASRENPGGTADAERDMVFVGMVGMIDPPRTEVFDAVAQCRKAKIRTVMITGDHKVTACAIAKQIGILRGGDMVMTGAEIDDMSPEEFQRTVHKVSVFARVNPGHKLAIVRALKKRGDIVAMTGDGVNDAPAVKEADIGVSMGITGTDVTKQASSIILLDDNFATLVAAVEEGRVVYGNIRKFIRYLLSCNIGEVVTMFAGMLMGLPVCCCPSDSAGESRHGRLPALALGLEPARRTSCSKSPGPPPIPCFPTACHHHHLPGLCDRAATPDGLTTFLRLGGGVDKARTAALVAQVLTQLFHVFECKSETKACGCQMAQQSQPDRGGGRIGPAGAGRAVRALLRMVFDTVPLTLPELGRVFAYSAVAPLLSSIWLSLPESTRTIWN